MGSVNRERSTRFTLYTAHEPIFIEFIQEYNITISIMRYTHEGYK